MADNLQVNTAESNNRSSQLTERTSEFGQKLVSPKFLLMVGIGASGALIVEGFICFTICIFNPRSYILSFYYILFGLLSIASEFKFKFISRNMKIISSNTGRGFWYLFLGSLALGGQWWSILIALVLIVLGILNMCAGFHNIKNKKKQPLSTRDQNNQNQNEFADSAPSVLQTIQLAKRASESVQSFEKAYDAPHEMAQNNNKPVSAYDDY